MRFGVLGQLSVWTADGLPVTIPELKVRALLAALLVDAGRPVSAHRLIDDLWGEQPPGNPRRALQAKVSQLRRVLEEAEPGGRDLVESRAPGYALVAPDDAVDSVRFARLADRARAVREPRARAALFTQALDLWRGEAFADFAEEPFTRATVNRLEEERLVVREELAEARLELGEHRILVGELTAMVERHPLRERLRSVHLRALYRAGRQSEALAGYEDLRARLADQLGLDPSPELAALQQAMLNQSPALEAPAAPAPPTGDPRPRAQLPAALTGLIGREEALAEVRELIGTRRLVTLTGPGGVGKTSLALEAARHLADTFPDGVCLVELAGSEPDTDIAGTVATALGVRDDAVWGVLPEDARLTTAGRLAEALRTKELLLVLDNCEHVADRAATLVETLLRSAPGLHVLTTSQEPLALAGETLWTVPTLRQSSAVELFAVRAAATSPGFVLDADTTPAVEAICRCLDGIPLAIELAATRVRALGVHRLLERLDDRFRLLSSGARGAPARQQTLRAVIDWSWELLTEPERTVLRRLAVHADGCTLEAAEDVCAGDGVDRADVLDLLVRLVDRSLLVAAPVAAGPRYRLLESVAAYCLEQLAGAGETDAVRERHLTHHLALAEDAGPRLRGPGQREWLDRLDTESANLRVALTHALHSGRTASALRLTASLAWYWVMRGRLGEGRRSLESALAAPGAAPEELRARVSVWGTAFAIMAGDGADRAVRIKDALAGYERAAGADAAGGGPEGNGSADGGSGGGGPAGGPGGAGDLSDPGGAGGPSGPAGPSGPGGDVAWRAHAAWILSHALRVTGDAPAGRALTEQALDGFRAGNDRWGTAAALADRSVQLLLAGALDGAGRDGTRSADLFRELGDDAARLCTIYPLASLAEIHGDYERAGSLQREGLRMAERLGLTTQAADLLSGLGRIALLAGDLGEARELHERSRRLAADQGFRAGEINAELGLGLGARREGDLDAAETHMRAVLDWHRTVGLDGANALILAELGFCAELRGDAPTALRLQEEGLTVARTTGDPRAVALALEGIAGALALADRHHEAAALLGTAAATRLATGAPLPLAERADVDRVTAAVLAALGPAAFAEHTALGAERPLETAYPATGSDAASAPDPALDPDPTPDPDPALDPAGG
ncbi:BTAD domain-containing putative transcriptional regulator [Streptomyces sp. NPDC004609]|uniref:BTAD domain-containing putative transcriptional regulator n=1 Tax=Streptomyces sp. NPDC004609 TaxID=3364704 RepID=UPI0036770801